MQALSGLRVLAMGPLDLLWPRMSAWLSAGGWGAGGVIRAWERGGSLGTAQTGEVSSLLWGVGPPAVRPCLEPRPYAVPVLHGQRLAGVWCVDKLCSVLGAEALASATRTVRTERVGTRACSEARRQVWV